MRKVKVRAWASCDMNGKPEVIWIRYPDLLNPRRIIKGEFVYALPKKAKGRKK